MIKAIDRMGYIVRTCNVYLKNIKLSSSIELV